MDEWYKKYGKQFTEEQALCFIHDEIEKAKFAYLEGDNTNYVHRLNELYAMLGDFIQRKVETEGIVLTDTTVKNTPKDSGSHGHPTYNYHPYFSYYPNAGRGRGRRR